MTYFVLVFTTINFFTNVTETHSVNYKFDNYESCRIARHIKTTDTVHFVIKATCVERQETE